MQGGEGGGGYRINLNQPQTPNKIVKEGITKKIKILT